VRAAAERGETAKAVVTAAVLEMGNVQIRPSAAADIVHRRKPEHSHIMTSVAIATMPALVARAAQPPTAATIPTHAVAAAAPSVPAVKHKKALLSLNLCKGAPPCGG